MRRGLALRAYLAVSYVIPLFANRILQRRLRRGKEHPDRWAEKLGQNLPTRPVGTVIWLHAVGLGEVLSLRGLITRMLAQNAALSFVVTSTTAASADVFAKNAPPRTQHMFLPLDAPRYRRQFLDHVRPDLCIWVEQDLWPGMVSDIAKRKTPQCVVAARMNAASFQSHQKARSLYRDLYQAMALVTAQDQTTASHLTALGADVDVTGSLKPAAPALANDHDLLADLKAQVGDRFVWAVSPAHDADSAIAKDAHERLCKNDPAALLIIAPRYPAQFSDTTLPRRSAEQLPQINDPIWVCDSFGELGTIYRLAKAVLIGGTFSTIEGHNPWEAAALETAIFHGPRIANFQSDFARLADGKAAIAVKDSAALARGLQDASLTQQAASALACVATAAKQTDALAERLARMIER